MMSDLYGIGCRKCCREVAAALANMPLMDGYLSTDGYAARYKHLPGGTWPLAYLDGVYKELTTDTVCGDDGWLLCYHRNDAGCSHPCACGSGDMARAVWRGKVELR